MKKVVISILIGVVAYIILNQTISKAETKTMKIVIDPGHGGYDTGAINYENGMFEKDITLKTARYLREYLLQYYGVEVIMTHDGLANDKDLEIVDRGMCARNNNADFMISIHFNADNYNQQEGAEEDRGLDITKGLGITSILVEHCFLRGEDVKYINSDEKLKRLSGTAF